MLEYQAELEGMVLEKAERLEGQGLGEVPEAMP